MSSPVFYARFFDGVETRMTACTPTIAKPSISSAAFGLSRHAYHQRTGKEPPVIVAGRFEDDGKVLVEYSADELAEIA